MAGFVGVSGPGTSRDEPDRQEGQVKPRKCSIRVVYYVAGRHHLVAGKLCFATDELKCGFYYNGFCVVVVFNFAELSCALTKRILYARALHTSETWHITSQMRQTNK